jgi:hypothetical protein
LSGANALDYFLLISPVIESEWKNHIAHHFDGDAKGNDFFDWTL